MEAELTHEDFAKSLNTTFQVQTDASNSVDLEAVELSELNQSAHQEQFSVVFRGPKEMFLGQGVRQFKHDQMGEFILFIVPINEDGTGCYYEATFNRVRSAEEAQVLKETQP